MNRTAAWVAVGTVFMGSVGAAYAKRDSIERYMNDVHSETARTAPDTTILSGAETAAPSPQPEAPLASSAAPIGVNCPAMNGIETTGTGHHILVHSPATNKVMSLVIVLHGVPSSPAETEARSQFTPFAAANNVIVAYPEGSPAQNNGKFGWKTTAGTAGNKADLQMIDDDITFLRLNKCVGKVILSGESAGAAMVMSAACNPAVNRLIDAVAPVITAIGGSPMSTCSPKVHPGLKSLPILAVAGGQDKTAIYSGNGAILPQENWFKTFAQQVNHCDGQLARDQINANVGTITASGCTVTTKMVVVADGGHAWPQANGNGAASPGNNAPTGTFDANSAILGLFESTN